MDPQDRPDDLLGGADCAACGGPVPAERIRRLAERDDLVFAELGCPACGSVSLAIVVRSDGAPAPLERGPRDLARPIATDDVLDMHDFLASCEGDLHVLLGGPEAKSAKRRGGRESGAA